MNDKLKFYRSTLVQIAKGLIGYTPMSKLAEDSDKITKEIIGKVDEFEVAMEQHFNLDKERVNYHFGGDNCVAKDFTCTDPNFFKSINPNYFKNDYPILKYACHLTQEDIDYILELIHLIYNDISAYVITKNEEKIKCAEDRLTIIGDYIRDSNYVRTRAQEKQLNKVIEENVNPKPKEETFTFKKPYGTLGEHWKELMVLFDFKCGFDNWKELLKSEIIPELLEYKCLKPRDHFFRNYYKAVNEVYQKLGIEFIEDFVKACEKCEE